MDDEQITSDNQQEQDSSSLGTESYSEDSLGREEEDEIVSGENGYSE